MTDTFTIEAHGHSYRIEDPGGIIGACLRGGSPYERKALEHICRTVDGGLAVDIGAGVGNHTLWFAAVCRLRVIAFEPLDHRRLVRNLALNCLPAVTTYPVALGDGTRTGGVTAAPEHVTGRALTPEDEVPIHRLDDYGLDPALVKIDVEGMEPDVLRGARETLERCRPVLYVEAVDEAAHRCNAAEIPRGYVHVKTFGATPLEEWVCSP